MAQILRYIQDPAWWFSAFLVAILASLVGSFLRDWISYVASKYSERARKKRRKRLVKMAKEVRALKKDASFLISYGIHLIIILLVVSLAFLLTVLMQLYEHHTQILSMASIETHVLQTRLIRSNRVIAIPILISIIICVFLLLRKATILIRVSYELRRSHKLVRR